MSNFQANEAKAPKPTVEPVIDEEVTLANADNLSVVDRELVSVAKEPTLFMTQYKVEQILRREIENSFISSIC